MSHGKGTAMDRTIDGLGRVVIPKNFRDAFGLKPGDLVTLSEENGTIVIRPPRRYFSRHEVRSILLKTVRMLGSTTPDEVLLEAVERAEEEAIAGGAVTEK